MLMISAPNLHLRRSAILTVDVCLTLDAHGQMACWAEYFQQLFMMDPPNRQLQTAKSQTVDAESPINKTLSTIDDVKETVVKLEDGKAAGTCNIGAELVKAGGEAIAYCPECCMTFKIHSS